MGRYEMHGTVPGTYMIFTECPHPTLSQSNPSAPIPLVICTAHFPDADTISKLHKGYPAIHQFLTSHA